MFDCKKDLVTFVHTTVIPIHFLNFIRKYCVRYLKNHILR